MDRSPTQLYIISTHYTIGYHISQGCVSLFYFFSETEENPKKKTQICSRFCGILLVYVRNENR